jgi:hypothetical protein
MTIWLYLINKKKVGIRIICVETKKSSFHDKEHRI